MATIATNPNPFRAVGLQGVLVAPCSSYRHGAAEARGAHNSEVTGSKPVAGILFSFIQQSQSKLFVVAIKLTRVRRQNVVIIRYVQVAIYELKMWTMWQGWKDEEQLRMRVEREYASLESLFKRVKKERDELRTERDELREEVDRLKAICSAMNAGQ